MKILNVFTWRLTSENTAEREFGAFTFSVFDFLYISKSILSWCTNSAPLYGLPIFLAGLKDLSI
jgi:hypothetical protein